MKVLHISGARSWGGNEQQLIDVIPELEDLGVENLVFGIKNSPLYNKLEKQDSIFFASKAPKIHKGKNFKFLKQIVTQYRPDLIHLHTSDSVTLFVISDIIYGLKTPAILSKKGISGSMSFLSLIKYNYSGLKKIICVSKAVEQDLKEKVIKPKNHKKLTVVYDGVNLNRTKPVRKERLRDLFKIPEGYKVIGNIANHVRAKDLDILIDMMNYLINALGVKNLYLIQIGEFSGLTDELKSKIKDFGLEDFITLAGFQEQAVDFIPQFDVYVMSSQREGLPLTIFEAFYKRTPVVSTKAGGIPEAITDGENGYLADIKDYEVLAKKVKNLIGNKELIDRFTERSEKIFHERFVAKVTAKNTLKVYESVLA